MDKAIITVLLIVGGITATLAIINGIMPAINQSQSAINNAASKASERIESRIQVIQASASGNQVQAWIKNTGTTTIYDIPHSDFFLGSSDNFAFVSYGGSTTPYWTYTLMGDAEEWRPAGTIGVTIYLPYAVSGGTYSVKMVVPSGVTGEAAFSVG